MRTCVLQDKAVAAERGITPESQEKSIGATFYAVWDISTVEASQQWAERVRSIVYVQEVIAGL